VRKVNKKNDSQSGVFSLKAPRMRGLSGSPSDAPAALALLAPVAAEVRVEQVHHGPEVAALFDVHLVEVAQVVERGARPPEQTLLLDARGLGVALRHDDAAEGAAVLAGHVVPHGLALVRAEADGAVPSPAG
jgi:hypothetical protein